MPSRRTRKSKEPTFHTALSYYTIDEAAEIIEKFAQEINAAKNEKIKQISVSSIRELLLFAVDTSNYLVYLTLKHLDLDSKDVKELDRFRENLIGIFFSILFNGIKLKERNSYFPGTQFALPSLPPDLAEETQQEFGWVFPVDFESDEVPILQLSVKPQTAIESSRRSKVKEIEFQLAEIDVDLAKELSEKFGWEFRASK